MKENPVILVVEDDQFNFDYLQVILDELNPKILWAQTADEGYDYFAKGDVDIVLMDLKLPGKSGLELTREIRAVDSRVPVIAQTAYAMYGDREKALDAGCNDYVSKPIRKAKLLALIKTFLRQIQ